MSEHERVRVLRIIDRLNVGGPALQATVLSEGLDPERFDHRILSGSVDPHEGDYVELRAPDLPVERIEGLGRAVNPLDDARALASLVQVIRSFRPHIVHTHKAKAGVLGRLAAWGNRVPATVHTFHGHLLHGYFSPSKTRVVVEVERLLAATHDRARGGRRPGARRAAHRQDRASGPVHGGPARGRAPDTTGARGGAPGPRAARPTFPSSASWPGSRR